MEADEDSDPKKFIQQLSGKLGQSLRKYNKEQGNPDFELEKFAVNSVLSATHTSEMDPQDQKDIIKKVKTSGNDQSNDNKDNTDDVDVDLNVDNAENTDNQDSGEEKPTEENVVYEEDTLKNKQPKNNLEGDNLVKSKKLSIFAPNNDMKETIKSKLRESINENNDKIGINLMSLLDGELAMAMREGGFDFRIYDDRVKFIQKIENRLMENDWISMSNGTTFEKTFTPTNKTNEKMTENNTETAEPIVKPDTKPVTKPGTSEPLRRNRPFLPKINPNVKPDPKGAI